MTMMATATDVLEAVRAIPDPEIPVITIEGLGILRECRLDEAAGLVHVVITPTYSGCPAMRAIEDQIARVCRAHGLRAVVTSQLSPAWTTDWISAEAKEKLRQYGIAPPVKSASDDPFAEPPAVPCPRCGSEHTTLRSQFGATGCKALYVCEDCREPFEYFKHF